MPKQKTPEAHSLQDRLKPVLGDPLTLICIGLGLFWLAVALFGRPLGDYGVETDFYGDARYAHQWLSGVPSLMNGYRGPGYHLVLGVLGTVFGDFFLAGKLLSVVAAAAGLRVLGSLLTSLWGRGAALAGVLFVAATPTFIHYTFRACTDCWFWLLFVGALALLFRRDDHVVRRWILAGAVSGVAWLTRYNGGVLLPIALLLAVLLVRPWPRAARAALGFVAAALVVASPWMAYLWHETGNPAWNKSYQLVAANIYGGNPSVAEQGKLTASVGFHSMAEVLAVDRGMVTRAVLHAVPGHLRSDAERLVGLPLAALAALGLALSLRSWRGRRPLGFALAGALTFAGLLPAFYNARFMLPLLVWWAAAAGGLGRFAMNRGRMLTAGTLLVLLGAVGYQNQAVIRRALDPAGNESSPREILELVRDIRKLGIPVGPDTPIIARKPQIGYCLNAPVVGVPYGTLDALFRSGARYLLVSGAEINAFPNLQVFVTHTEDPPPGLKYLASVRHQIRGSFLFAAFYEITRHLPKEPAAEAAPEEPVVTGLSRLDALRIRLARWYLTWEPRRPVRGLLDRIAPADRNQLEVLLVRGDAAWSDKDTVLARRTYQEAVTRYPEAARARYRLAGLRLLEDPKLLRPRDALAGVIVPAAAGPDTASWWLSQATSMLVSGEYQAAVAPCLACLDYDPHHVTCYRTLGDALTRGGYLEEALAAYQTYARSVPGDQQVKQLIQALHRALAQKGR